MPFTVDSVPCFDGHKIEWFTKFTNRTKKSYDKAVGGRPVI